MRAPTPLEIARRILDKGTINLQVDPKFCNFPPSLDEVNYVLIQTGPFMHHDLDVDEEGLSFTTIVDEEATLLEIPWVAVVSMSDADGLCPDHPVTEKSDLDDVLWGLTEEHKPLTVDVHEFAQRLLSGTLDDDLDLFEVEVDFLEDLLQRDEISEEDYDRTLNIAERLMW